MELFSPTNWPKEPFVDGLRCRDCEKENADHFFHIDEDWSEYYCTRCLRGDAITTEGVSSEPGICDHCKLAVDATTFMTVIQYSGGGGVNLCKKCTKEVIDFKNSLGGSLESYGGNEEKTKNQIKRWINHIQSITPKRNPIPPAFRHEVLKAANYKCQECGIPKEQRPLEIDHIVPIARGGSDELSNLQALCVVCNRAKQNRSWHAGKHD